MNMFLTREKLHKIKQVTQHHTSVLTLWQRQTPQAKAETDLLHLETSLSPARAGKTFQSRHAQHKDQTNRHRVR